MGTVQGKDTDGDIERPLHAVGNTLCSYASQGNLQAVREIVERFKAAYGSAAPLLHYNDLPMGKVTQTHI